MKPWKEKKDELCRTIKRVSDAWGGDDIEWLRDYARQVVVQNQDSLDAALGAFESLARQSSMWNKEERDAQRTERRQ